MKKTAKLFTVLLTFAMVLTLAMPMTTEAASKKAPKLNKTKATLAITKKKAKPTYKLKVKNTAGKRVTWTTSNKKVATVSKKGVVTAKKKGTVIIKAKVGKKVLKCKVTIKDNRKVVKKPVTKPTCQHNWKKVYVEKVTYIDVCSCGKKFTSKEEHEQHAMEAIWNGDTNPHSAGTRQKKESVFDHWKCTKCGATKK